MDKPAFNQQLSTALGGNLIDVELTSADFDHAFNLAKRTFIQKGNNNLNRKFIPIPIVANQTVYTGIPDEVDTIIRIIRPKTGFTSTDPISMTVFNQMFNPGTSAGGGMLSYEILTQYIELLQMYMVHDVQFIYKKRLKTLTLLKVPAVSENWVIEAYCDLTDDEYRDLLWVQLYATAEAKTILGRAYSKFQAISTPAGDSSLGGDVLIQEGKAEQEQLIKDIDDYVDGDPSGGAIILA